MSPVPCPDLHRHRPPVAQPTNPQTGSSRQTRHRLSTRNGRALLAAVLLALPGLAAAYNFQLNETEFRQWDDFCKLAYLGSPPGRSSIHSQRYSSASIEQGWEAARTTGVGPWHMCAGLIWMDRAVRTPAGRERDYMLEQAENEARVTFARARPGDNFWARSALVIARARIEMRDYESAEALLLQVIAQEPQRASAHEALYLAYRRRGAPRSDRIAVLETGNKAVEGKSAQLHYFLGLEYLEAGRRGDAEAHAEQAYAMGYPLPGLRDKLRSGRAASVAR